MNYTPAQTQKIRDLHFAFLQVEEENHVLEIHLNRPEQRNAINPTLLRELAFALHYARYENRIRAVVIAAKGPVFCAGADLKAFMGQPQPDESTIPAPNGEILIGGLFQELGKPSIALVEGHVFAGGFLILAGCMYVIAREDLRFGLPEVHRGLFPFQVMAALFEVLPKRKVLDWCVRGRELPVKEAHQLGLVTHLVTPESQKKVLQNLLDEICTGSPAAIRAGLEAAQQISQLPASEQYSYLQKQLMKTVQSADAKEGILAFREKRKPNWQ